VPPAKLPFTYTITKPNGRTYWRFRRGETRGSLPGKPGDPTFHARYAALLALSQHRKPEPDTSTLSWLIGQYRKSAELNALRESTRLDYDRALTVLDSEMGTEPFALITPLMVKAVRDGFRETPRKAHKVKQIASLLYTWAGENDHVPLGHNPAAPIRRLKTRTKPIEPWSEEEITLFLAHCPTELRTPFLLALCTGQRAADVVAMEWSAYQGAFIRVRQSKTGEPLDIACHPALRAHLDAIRTSFGGLIARTALKRPYSANGFAQHIRRVADTIHGFPKHRSPHGLRYAAAGRLDEAGVSPVDASAVLGHRTYRLAMEYLAGRKRSAAAMAKLASNEAAKC
jgi:integrase